MNKRKSNSAKGANQYDVVIVGAGVSGIYSGWRLLTGKPGESEHMKKWGKNGKLKVAVFEGSDRIGGRLLSARPPGFPDTTTCEIGGMRYVSSQTLVRSLVENELRLQRYEQIVDQDDNLMYLRGKQLRFSQNQDPSAMPYNLDWAEAQYIQNNDPSGLIGWGISKFLPELRTGLTGTALHDYLRKAEVDGTPLYQHGFWNLLARTLSPDAYEVARTLVGYDCLGSNANAADLIAEYFDFTPTVHYYLFNEGYDAVPWTLQKRFEEAGGEVIQKTWVAGFDKKTLDDGSLGVEVHFRGGRRSVTARAIILAMPRRSLELLDRKGPVFSPQAKDAANVQHMINSVRPIPLYKLFLAYEYPWWNSVALPPSADPDDPQVPNPPPPALQGRSLTDTPVRQLYYWPIDPAASSQPATGNALLMAYNDATNVDFWAGLSGKRTSKPHDDATRQHFRKWFPEVPMFKPQVSKASTSSGHNEYTGRLHKNWRDREAPHEVVMEMHRQIKRMHNIQYAPKPIDAAFMDWSEDPYGGGVHFWNRGYQSWKILEDMTQPVSDFPCYICGEAYSTNQTWVEGALQTAEIVLKKLGLKKPSWVTPNPPAKPAPSLKKHKAAAAKAK